jgi:hypothetical protein
MVTDLDYTWPILGLSYRLEQRPSRPWGQETTPGTLSDSLGSDRMSAPGEGMGKGAQRSTKGLTLSALAFDTRGSPFRATPAYDIIYLARERV